MIKTLKNQKGMTLVELLAVMVIVGIIAAISIPAIGGLLENTRKDSFVSNAVALQEAARLYYANNESTDPVTITWTAKASSTTEGNWDPTDFAGYLENFVDSSNKNEVFKSATVTITKDNATGEVTYETSLEGGKYSLSGDDAKNYTRATVVTN